MILYLVIFFVLGLVFGSFANVCIARIPQNKSIITPRSSCPKCNKPIKWFDNLPIISYLLLKAKCRECGEKISIQYPLVEFITGAVFIALAWSFKGSPLLAGYLIFTLILIIISVVDFHSQIIPDSLSLAILLLGLCMSPFNHELGAGVPTRILNSVLGILTGGGSLFLIGLIAEKIMRKEAMGGGDVKLLAGIGALLGWAKVFSVLFIASLIGSVFGIIAYIYKANRTDRLYPFWAIPVVVSILEPFLPNLVGFLFVFGK